MISEKTIADSGQQDPATNFMLMSERAFKQRDAALATVADLVKALEGFIASTDMIGRSRFHYAAEYDRFCKIRSDAIAAVAAAKGTGR